MKLPRKKKKKIPKGFYCWNDTTGVCGMYSKKEGYRGKCTLLSTSISRVFTVLKECGIKEPKL